MVTVLPVAALLVGACFGQTETGGVANGNVWVVFPHESKLLYLSGVLDAHVTLRKMGTITASDYEGLAPKIPLGKMIDALDALYRNDSWRPIPVLWMLVYLHGHYGHPDDVDGLEQLRVAALREAIQK